MIVQEFNLSIIPWQVTVFYHSSRKHLGFIIQSLTKAGCTGEILDDIVEFLHKEVKNTGCTWSSEDLRMSVIVIAETTDAAQFNDTYDHEKGHLAMHICQAEGIDPFGEEYQYVTGEIGRLMFLAAQHFLCDECRKKSINNVI